ncbi:hypothetical protein M513_02853 [Trichuris suis]|uniref:Uncharacterized protein n=1 Tax=Trichuris suis TaxID=68888 RepID=A0A085MGQ2_9BILA|nr:hypothetical protein M513_02853 [Trichuris suis]
MGTERAIEWEPKGLLNCRRRKGERAIEREPKGQLNGSLKAHGRTHSVTQSGNLSRHMKTHQNDMTDAQTFVHEGCLSENQNSKWKV